MTQAIEAPWDLIVADYHTGMNQHALAAKYSITQGTISYQLRKRTTVRKLERSAYKKRGSKLDHKYVCSQYEKGLTAAQIARNLNVSKNTICTILKNNHIEKHPLLTESIENDRVISLYLSGISIKKIAKEYKVSPTPIKDILIKHNIEIKPPTCYKIYSINSSVFDNLTPDAQYWLGMLATDGTVYYTKYGKARVGLLLQERDKSHVEEFSKFLGSNYPLYRTSNTSDDGTVRHYWRVCVASDELADSLKLYNIVPQKTHSLDVLHPILLDSVHFWRGVLDGDGNISSRGAYNLMLSSKKFIEKFQYFVNKYESFPTVRSEIKDGRTYWSLGGSSQKMLIEMYSSKSAKLDRKYQTVKDLIEEKMGEQ